MSKTPHPIDVHVGNRVRFRRMSLSISQEKLGEQLGLTFQQIQKYEKGANRIGASRLYKIAQVLDVSVDFFFDEIPEDVDAETGSGGSNGGSERAGAPQLMGFVGSVEGVQLNAAFASISDQDVRKRVLDLIKTIAAKENGDDLAATSSGASSRASSPASSELRRTA